MGIKKLNEMCRLRNWSIHTNRKGQLNGFSKRDYYVHI